MTDERPLTAHEILAEHVTNVSPVTRDVIHRAIAEYNAVAARVGQQPVDVQIANAMLQLLHDIDGAAEIFERTLHGIRARIHGILQLESVQREAGGGSNGAS